MLFNSFCYLFFLPLVVLLYWNAPKRLRLLLLLISSYVFYMSWRIEYGLLLFGLTALNYLFGLALASDYYAKSVKRLTFVAALSINLATLGIFKYTNFFFSSAYSFWHIASSTRASLPGETTLADLQIVLPLGISFFVFEFIHYLADVYTSKAPPIKSPLRFALFAAFFPSQIAGPIKRFEDFDAQAQAEKRFSFNEFQFGLYLIVLGLFKKCALADNFSNLANIAFENCHKIGCLDAWAGVLAFTFQIYYDFSGYTDIGIGSAKLLGYNLPPNFNMPYIAKNMSEFWRRWHISLSTWLRDYLYIPLGGSKHGVPAQMRNLCITMLLGGLWHGASWTFVFWGAFQGLGLVIAHSWESITGQIAIFKNESLKSLWNGSAWVITFLFVMFGWVLFRARTLDQAAAIYSSMFNFYQWGSIYDNQVFRIFTESTLPIGILSYALFYNVQKLVLRRRGFQETHESAWLTWLQLPLEARALAFIGICVFIIGLAPTISSPFIYFQF